MPTFYAMTGRDTCNGSCETASGCHCNTKPEPPLVSRIDAAVTEHATHGAMACGDPLTECLTKQFLQPQTEPGPEFERMAGVLLAVAMGLVGALLLVHWVSAD